MRKFYICVNDVPEAPFFKPAKMYQQSLAIILMVLISGLTFLHVIAHKRQQKEVKRFLERSVGMELSEDLFLPANAKFEHLKKATKLFWVETNTTF